jgi:hypothetical protein
MKFVGDDDALDFSAGLYEAATFFPGDACQRIQAVLVSKGSANSSSGSSDHGSFR